MAKRIECPLPNHKGEWIERADEVSIGYWNRWRVADHDQTQKMVVEILTDWNLIGADGKPAPKPTEGQQALDAVGINLLGWLVRAITDSIVEDQKLSPNESAPSSD